MLMMLLPDEVTLGVTPFHCSYLIFSIRAGVRDAAIFWLAAASASAAIRTTSAAALASMMSVYDRISAASLSFWAWMRATSRSFSA